MKDTPVRYLKGVGPKKAAKFNSLGVNNVYDLLYYFPFRYEDRRDFRKIKDVSANQICAVRGKIVTLRLKKIPYFVRKSRVRSVLEVFLKDSSGIISCVWFNQEYLADTLSEGKELFVWGKVTQKGRKYQIVAPKFETANSKFSLELGKIVGLYRLSPPFTQRFMRKVITTALNDFSKEARDPLPYRIRSRVKMPNIVESLQEIHSPGNYDKLSAARERFVFEELFFSQILVYLRKAKHRSQKGPCFKITQEITGALRNNLDFTLTASQDEAVSKILDDISKPYPMRRLLQGDVGCGKTVVCSFPIGVCASCKWQAALMVPTEILAWQHKATLERIFKGLGFKIEAITSSLPNKELKSIYAALEKGEIDIIVGTHALIQEQIKFSRLGLVVIDEEHRFGVAQRILLPNKGQVNPHCLIMSATPIPRSLALSIYGDLDLSTINELPAGRIPPETSIVKEDKRQEVYAFLREKLKEERQAYIVYPVIDESKAQDLKSLKVMHRELSKEFSSYTVGMFHGRLSVQEKQKSIRDFCDKRIQIMVCTTVIEVGINIENATVMIVENPERFGLAQLHQLRGRIQRSRFKPYFILISPLNIPDMALKRIEVLRNVSDGFAISEEDLKIRGPGDFFGFLQHGFPFLKIANPLTDIEMLYKARVYAFQVIKEDPFLEKQSNRCIRYHINSHFGHMRKEIDILYSK
ncbi:MAG: ATP-dependent DNA helicase RecG [Candidatus Omnitrophota bacterium]